MDAKIGILLDSMITAVLGSIVLFMNPHHWGSRLFAALGISIWWMTKRQRDKQDK